MKSYKVGAVVLATDQGLGYLAKSYFDHGLIDYVYIHPHSSRINHYEWYPAERTVSDPGDLLKCDTIVFFEEPFYWKLIPQARERGVTTKLMVMYECTRNPLPYVPDVVLCPSLLDHQYYPDGYLHIVPVAVPWRIRSVAETFVHNAGNGGLGGRNGTREVIEAWKHVQSPAKLILRSQVPVEADDPRIEVRVGQFEDIWDEGDVFIFPEKFNGLSLPLQEAFASGMLVMAGDRFPINTWLPKEPLIPVQEYVKERISVEFDSARYNPLDIGRKVDEWYGKDITQYSLKGKEWAEAHGWDSVDKSIFSPIVKE